MTDQQRDIPAILPRCTNRHLTEYARHRAVRHRITRRDALDRALDTAANTPGLPTETKRAIAMHAADNHFQLWELEQLLGDVPSPVADWYQAQLDGVPS